MHINNTIIIINMYYTAELIHWNTMFKTTVRHVVYKCTTTTDRIAKLNHDERQTKEAESARILSTV